jgi:hypothetical protein
MSFTQELTKIATEDCIEMGVIIYIAAVVTLIAIRQKNNQNQST